MASPKTIALDAMGGDHGPSVVIAGAALSLERHPSLSFMLFGDEAQIKAVLAKTLCQIGDGQLAFLGLNSANPFSPARGGA